MNTLRKVSLVGGDARQLYLAHLFSREGFSVTTHALSAGSFDPAPLAASQIVLLPMPMTDKTGGLFAPLYPEPIPTACVLDALRSEQYIFAGKVPATTAQQASRRGLTIRDYLLRPELTIANAVPTAEGAVQLAMEALPITLHRSQVLVTGCGAVGQCTAQRFLALGANVTVCARSPAQLALAESLGCSPLPLDRLGRDGGSWDLVVNTVPAPILTIERLAALGAPVLLELASPPGGFDPADAAALGLRSIAAPGLPGRVAPHTAARAIFDTVRRMMAEPDL